MKIVFWTMFIEKSIDIGTSRNTHSTLKLHIFYHFLGRESALEIPVYPTLLVGKLAQEADFDFN